jgi:two-component sensor histidine kinase
MSLSLRLIILVVAAFVPLIALQLFTQHSLRLSREKDIRLQVTRDAERIASQQQSLHEGVRQLLQMLALESEIRSADAQRCEELFSGLRQHFQRFEAFAATKSNGVVFCSTTPNARDGSLADRHYFAEAMQTGRLSVGEYSIGRFTGKRVLSFALPYDDSAGERGGVVAVSIGLDWLAEQFNSGAWNERHRLVVADRNGTIVVAKPDSSQLGHKIPSERWHTIQATDAPSAIDIESEAGTEILGFVPPVVGPGGFYVGVAVNRDAVFAALDRSTWIAAFVNAAAILAAVSLAILFIRMLVKKPVNHLLQVADQWQAGNYVARANMIGFSEVHQLGKAFDRMAAEVQHQFKQKELLFRELNHRIMNSLQTISALFLLQAKSVADPGVRNYFDQAATRINSVALAYRRMHSADGIESIEFSQFLHELCADLQRSLMIEGAPCVVEADPIFLSPDQAMPLALIVNELVTNALKHGKVSGGVTIKLGRSNSGCRLAVRSQAQLRPGFDPENADGFGMKMVCAMARTLGGAIEASSMGGETEFALSFMPKSPQPTILRVVQDGAGEGDVRV